MDEFYNDVFAKKVVSIISKMDDDEAEMFMRFSTHSVLMADIEANRRTLDSHTVEVHKALQARAARALSSLVSKSAGVDYKAIAALIGSVSEVRKDRTPYEELYGKPQPRGKGGRWSVSISRESSRDYKHAADRNGLPNPKRDRGDVMVGPNFNLTGALSDKRGGRVSEFANDWNADKPEYASTNRRTYDRIATGSKALAYSNDPKMKAAGQVGQFFGKYGPEAEKVVGPHLRRTAYRYRGTERRPDSALIQGANDSSRAIMRNEGIEQHDFTPAMRTEASQRAAIQYLGSRLPKKGLTKLQQASGKIPPSEGVIINEDGKIITQAVGYMDDHYLPFNLKNLKGLQGGHYVRSRSQGGLTTEDIYTGLVSGARSVTVVSRSGVFTVNFEDDFRGGRRYNDKAAQMVGRYAKTLDAVKSQQVEREPLSMEERAEIRDEVEREYEDDEYISRADLEDLIKEREKEYRSRPTLTKAELAEIDAKAKKDNPGEREQKIARSELISAALEAKTQRAYQLDGEGYDVAQEALREQFPYYIASVRAIHRKNAQYDNNFSTETDKGYVKPRYLRPEGAKEGYFDPTITGSTGKDKATGRPTGKVSADRTNYANWAHNPERARVSRANLTPVEDEEARAAGISPDKAKSLKVKEDIARGKRGAAADQALEKLVGIYGGALNEDDLKDYPTINRARADFQTVASSPTARGKLVDELNKAHKRAEGKSDWADEYNEAAPLFKAMRAAQSGSRFDLAKAGEKPEVPFEFDVEGGKKAAYSAAANDVEIEHEWARQAKKVGGISIGQLSDDELAKRASAFGQAGHALKSGEMGDIAEMMARANMPDHQITAALRAAERGNAEEEGDKFLKISESYHRLRRLQHNHSGSEAKPKGSAVARREPEEEPSQLTEDVRLKVGDVNGAVKTLTSLANDPQIQTHSPAMAKAYKNLGLSLNNGKAETKRVMRSIANSGTLDDKQVEHLIDILERHGIDLHDED